MKRDTTHAIIAKLIEAGYRLTIEPPIRGPKKFRVTIMLSTITYGFGAADSLPGAIRAAIRLAIILGRIEMKQFTPDGKGVPA